MPTASLLLLAIAGGYLFVHRFNGTRWKVAFYKWDRALLLSSIWGLGFFVGLRCIPVVCEALLRASLIEPLESWTVALASWGLLGVELARAVSSTAHVPLLGTFLGVAMLGGALPPLLNRLPWFDRESHQVHAVRALADRMSRLFVDSMLESVHTETDVLVEVTLQNRKVYVGVVLEFPNVETEERHLVLQPILSGYRDKDDLDVHWTTDYEEAYDELRSDDLENRIREFAVVLPHREIVSARRFDLDFHEQFFATDDPALAEGESDPIGSAPRPTGCGAAILGLAALLSVAVAAGAVDRPDPARFAADIRAFEVADSAFRARSGSVVFYGSSSIRMWHPRLADDFPQLTVVGRGFGGSTMSEAAHWASRAVTPLVPRAVVLYEGDNDIEMGRTPAEVLADFEALLVKVQWPTRVYVIGIKPSAARWAHWPRAQEANRGFARRCSREPRRLFYVDVAGPMLNDEGKPRPELFLEDRLHLSALGYDVWRDVVGRALERELQYEPDAVR